MKTSVAILIGILIGLILFFPISYFVFWISDKIDDYKYRRIRGKSKYVSHQKTSIDVVVKNHESSKWRHCHFVKYNSVDRDTYRCTYHNKPGYQQEQFLVYTDTDMLDLQEVIELEDGTKLHVCWENKRQYAKKGNVYGYKFRIVTNDPERFVNPEMLAEGKSFYIVPVKFEDK